tara:strand:- start:12 stop:260 length:249 start_codon:yes stop_codon:yes gene_type:complete
MIALVHRKIEIVESKNPNILAILWAEFLNSLMHQYSPIKEHWIRKSIPEAPPIKNRSQKVGSKSITELSGTKSPLKNTFSAL